MIEQFIAFRTDAGSLLGTGHFMRCLTLADGLRRHGARIRFVSRDLPAHLREMLAARGMELSPLSGAELASQAGDLAHSHWLAASQEQDAQATIRALSDRLWDWLVVDHYALDARWESAVRPTTGRIMVIDDLADRRHDCELLLDQNCYADQGTRYAGKAPEHCRLLLGPRYALLREEFSALREKVKPRTGLVGKVLVFFGGVDAGNYTGIAIEALAGLAVKGLHVDVVIGAQHPRRSDIEKACATHGYVCHVQTSRMAELMAAADLAIGAGGSATWERCCLGLPALSICVAENQRRQLADAAEQGLLYAPSTNGNPVDMLKCHITALLENAPLLRLVSRTALAAVDGRGGVRVAGAMGLSGIEIRTANEDDSRMLFEWRNHPAIRAASRSSELITWEDHHTWLAGVMADRDRVLLIGCIGEHPVGVVRFDKQGDDAEISIYLVPDSGFSGLGYSLLSSAEQWLRSNRPDIKRIRAGVLGENRHSQRLFLGANYRPETISYLKEIQSQGEPYEDR